MDQYAFLLQLQAQKLAAKIVQGSLVTTMQKAGGIHH
jgi:hypothetical protein